MNQKKVLKIAIAGLFAAVAVALSAFAIPIGMAKVFPVQHAVNILLGVLIGPWYALGAAFVTSTIRVLIGTGSLLAYPGSMIGAFACGMLYRMYGNMALAVVGEVVGTGILGALVAFPIAVGILGREAAMFGFVVPFSSSACAGAVISLGILFALKRVGALQKMKITLEGEH